MSRAERRRAERLMIEEATARVNAAKARLAPPELKGHWRLDDPRMPEWLRRTGLDYPTTGPTIIGMALGGIAWGFNSLEQQDDIIRYINQLNADAERGAELATRTGSE